MALYFKTVKQKVLAGESAGEWKWYGRICTGTNVTFEQICARVARHSTATAADVSIVLRETLRRIPDYLAEGKVVQMGGLCNLRLSAGSKGTDDPDDFTLKHMKRPRVIFHPGSKIRRMLRDVKFKKKNHIHTVWEDEPCSEH